MSMNEKENAFENFTVIAASLKNIVVKTILPTNTTIMFYCQLLLSGDQ